MTALAGRHASRAASVGVLVGVLGSNAVHAQVASLLDPGLSVSTVASGLAQPITMAFIGPDDILVTEDARERLFRVPGSHPRDPEFSWKYVVPPAGLGFIDGSGIGEQYDGDLIVGSAVARAIPGSPADPGSLYFGAASFASCCGPGVCQALLSLARCCDWLGASPNALPRQALLAETGVVGGDSVRGRASLVSGREHNGSAPRTHRRTVDGTGGKHSRKAGKVSRAASAVRREEE